MRGEIYRKTRNKERKGKEILSKNKGNQRQVSLIWNIYFESFFFFRNDEDFGGCLFYSNFLKQGVLLLHRIVKLKDSGIGGTTAFYMKFMRCGEC